jgi:putative nucleotidyltransferase with HDIG domain
MSSTNVATNFKATTNDPLDLYLDGIKNLPPTPVLMVKLLELFRQSDCDIDAVVRLMRRDPALAAEVLRQCNNTVFSDEEPLTDIHEAVFRLGFYQIYRLCVALFGMEALSLRGDMQDFPVESLRRHSGITALAAGAIARELGEAEGTAFTAGLLHDVGKVALAAAGGSKYAELMLVCGHIGAELSQAEKLTFGFDHGEVGARLLHRWGVPEVVSVPALFHHDPPSSGPFWRPIAIVHLADLMAHQIQFASANKLSETPGVLDAIALLDLNLDLLAALEYQVHNDLKTLPSLLRS